MGRTALDVLALANAIAGAASLALTILGVHGRNLDTKDGLNGLLDLGLVGAWIDDERVLTFVFHHGRLFRCHR